MPTEIVQREIGPPETSRAATPKSAAPQGCMTLLDTALHEDAILCGADCADSESMAFKVEFENVTFSWAKLAKPCPMVTLNGPDGEIQIVGLSAIRQFSKALVTALNLAERAVGQSDRKAA